MLGDGHYYDLEPSDWELMRTGDVSTTKFKVALGRLGQLDGNTLRLRGYKNPTYPASEVTSFEVWTPFLVAAATAKLLTGPLDNPQSDPQGKLSNLQYWATQEESERKRARTAIAPNTQWFL
ncbi:MAG: hypothetical protein NTZ05_04135 [Chloroflexi bacterium]|nr:hypothetical protein [Chloroflexota bacterium]